VAPRQPKQASWPSTRLTNNSVWRSTWGRVQAKSSEGNFAALLFFYQSLRVIFFNPYARLDKTSLLNPDFRFGQPLLFESSLAFLLTISVIPDPYRRKRSRVGPVPLRQVAEYLRFRGVTVVKRGDRRMASKLQAFSVASARVDFF